MEIKVLWTQNTSVCSEILPISFTIATAIQTIHYVRVCFTILAWNSSLSYNYLSYFTPSADSDSAGCWLLLISIEANGDEGSSALPKEFLTHILVGHDILCLKWNERLLLPPQPHSRVVSVHHYTAVLQSSSCCIIQMCNFMLPLFLNW